MKRATIVPTTKIKQQNKKKKMHRFSQMGELNTDQCKSDESSAKAVCMTHLRHPIIFSF